MTTASAIRTTLRGKQTLRLPPAAFGQSVDLLASAYRRSEDVVIEAIVVQETEIPRRGAIG
jgi:hypothetical protein